MYDDNAVVWYGHSLDNFSAGTFQGLLTQNTGRAYVLDVADPAMMAQVYGGWVGGILYGDLFPRRDRDGVFPIDWHVRGIAWYSLNGKVPEKVTSRMPPNGSQTDGIDLLGDGRFIFPVRGSELPFIDPASPEAPNVVEVKAIPAGMSACGIPTVNGNVVPFAARREGKWSR